MTARKKWNPARRGSFGRGALLAGAALLGMLAALVLGDGAARAAGEDAPQVLSTELSESQVVTEPKLTATFVIVGAHPIRQIYINGEAQTFTAGDTVQITKDFEFTARQTVITVRVEDENSNMVERRYVVYFGAAPVETRWSVRGSGELRYEVDENPTNDVGLPFTVSGIDVKGVIPASQRPDNRSTASLNLIGTRGPASIFGGGLSQQYDKSINKGLNTTLAYGGAGYRLRLSDASDFVANYIYSSLNVGSQDYATLNTLSGGYEYRSQDARFNRRHLFEADITAKDFKSSSQTDGSVGLLKWDYMRTAPATLDSYTSLLQLGNATEGDKASDYNFLGGDWDWRNIWGGGFRWDIGFGYQYRDFPNDKKPITTALGPERVDHLFRVSTGLGWQWMPQWSAMFNYRYLTDLSNKSPYVRPIYGLSVTGGF